MGFNIAVIYGSVRSSRVGIKGATFIVKQLEKRGHTTTLVDPMEHKLPLLDKMYKEHPDGEAPKEMEAIASVLKKADAFVVVSAEYNHSIPAALKNLLDHFQKEYFFKPSGIATYSVGSMGGVRAAMHLRDILPELGSVTIPSIFAMSKVHDSFDDEGNAVDKAYERRIKKFLDELEWYTQALKEAREKGVPY